MNGGTAIYNVLTNDSTVLSLVDTINSYPCIAVKVVTPPEWDIQDRVINIYTPTVTDKSLEYLTTQWTVNCRGATQRKAEELARAVTEALDRKAIEVTKGRFYCQEGFILQPVNESDNYNMPVEVYIKGIKNLD